MDNILLSAALAFIISFFAIPVIIQIAKDKKLFDEPDERKVHKTVIPTLGGLGIFAGFIMAFLLGTPAGISTDIQYIAAASIVIFFLGLKDDILVISASKKFIGQLIAAGILIRYAGVEITNMHGFLGLYEIPPFASITFSFLTIIVITNSFNLIDGVDGLAGSLGVLTTLIFGIYFYNIGQLTYAVMAFAMAGSVISFLIYNFSPAKIFMGDTGSLLLGLVNSIFVIKFINSAGTVGMFSFDILNVAPAIGFAILMVPLFDTLRVFGLRILSRRSPFSPDRNHVHHFLLDLGFTHKQITFTLVSINIFFIAVALATKNMGTTVVIGILLSTAVSLTFLLYYLRNKSKVPVLPLAKTEKSEMVTTHKVFGIMAEPVEMD
ncbi:MAG TPA: MraY family glycosyltransferase [Ferruginibacter sp.]|nr:MraY family glycosyltransferase [Ferruginibacter sp.]HRE63850.1 MraY family glycosyltransferase [Ferruginibacter sp.]